MGDGLCHRDEPTHFIAASYSFSCNRFPSSDPSFAIRCPRALKTLCGRLEIVDRRDDHALIGSDVRRQIQFINNFFEVAA